MKRRDFIALISGAAAAWPIAVLAQQGMRVWRVVFLHGRAEDDSEEQARIVAFRQGLEALGWTANRNIKDRASIFRRRSCANSDFYRRGGEFATGPHCRQ